MIAIGLLFVRMLCDCFKPRQQLQVEILVLRHQLNVLRQRAPRRPHLRWTDRALFIWLYRCCPRILSAITIVRPETVLRWHRMGFVAYWRWKSRSPGGRPRIAKEVRDLIRRMARVNDGALHAGSSSESSPPVPFPRRPHQRGTSDRGSRLAAHHVDGSLAASFRRNLVSLSAATRTRRLHVMVCRGGIGGLLVGRDRPRIIIAAVPIVIVPEGYGQAADTPMVAVVESTGKPAEVPAARAATYATATHATADVSAARASTPMTGSAATERGGVGRDYGTSQCRGNNKDCNSVQHKFLHGRYLFCSSSTCRCAVCLSGIERSQVA